MLRLSEDYDFLKVDVSSEPDEIPVRIRVPPFDSSEMRAIKEKQMTTGFINAAELMQLQKATTKKPETKFDGSGISQLTASGPRMLGPS